MRIVRMGHRPSVYNSRMDSNWWLTFVGSFTTGLLGGAAAVAGAAKFLGRWWLEKQKARYAQELEEFRHKLHQQSSRIQAEIDRSVFVTRAHFETEFSAMKEVFAKLAEVRLQISALRPFFGVQPANDTRDTRLKRLADQLQRFSAAYNELLATTENLKPFYPESIHAAVEECRRAAHAEIVQIQTAGDQSFTTDWYSNGDDNITRFLTAYNSVTDLMRQRISQLAIVRDTA